MTGLLIAIPGATPSASSAPSFGAGVVSFSFLLSTLVWLPVLVATVLALLPDPRQRQQRYMVQTAFWTNIVLLVLVLIAYSQFGLVTTGLQFEEKVPWIPALGVNYHLGVDGIGMTMLLLSALMGVVSVLASAGIRERPRQYFCLLLLAEASANGVVVARDLFVLLLFWAAAAMPLTLLVGGWGGPRREQAAVRLLAYWGLGSVALAGAALMLYVAAGGVGFDLDLLLKASPTPRAQVAVAVALIVAAATRLPLVPFHAWARDVLAEAPVGVAVLVAGLGARLGGYLLLRLLVGGEHDGARLLAPFLAAMAGLTVAYAGLAALRRDDVRRVGAYAALVPGGITALGVSGLTPLAVDGTVLSLLAGGLVAALIVGACATVAERANTRSLALLGGLATRVPVLAWLLVLAVLAVLGVPGLASFAAQLLVVLGSFRNQPAGVLGVLVGLVLATVAMGGLLYRVLFSAPNPDAPGASEVSLSETWYLGLLAGSLIYFGVLPGGPKLAGVPIFDPGIINVLSASSSDLASPYLPGGAQAGGGTP